MSHRIYTPEFKDEAVRQVIERGSSTGAGIGFSVSGRRSRPLVRTQVALAGSRTTSGGLRSGTLSVLECRNGSQ